jgi:hypothetical protein
MIRPVLRHFSAHHINREARTGKEEGTCFAKLDWIQVGDRAGYVSVIHD